MKTKLLAALIAFLLLGGSILYGQMQVPDEMVSITSPENKASAFPDVQFKSADDKRFRIADIKQKTILVHFWAAWCAPCHVEYPALLNYVKQSKGKVALISVSLDPKYEDSQKALDAIAKKHNLSLNDANLYWVWDKDKSLSLKHFGTIKVPETIVIKDGLMVDKIVGEGKWRAR